MQNQAARRHRVSGRGANEEKEHSRGSSTHRRLRSSHSLTMRPRRITAAAAPAVHPPAARPPADHHRTAARHRAAVHVKGNDNMKHQSFTLAVVVGALAIGGFAGCYTKLMPFRDAVASRKASVSHAQGGNFTSDLNYRDNCLSCHSEAELNDRAQDMDYAGIHNVHGLTYDPYGWQNPYSQPTWWAPEPPVFIGVGGGTPAQPVLIKNPVITTTPASPSNAARRRETGTTRGDNGRTRDPIPAASTTPTSTTTTTSAGTSTPAPTVTTPPPATQAPTVTTQPAQTTQAPAATPSQDTRTRSTGTEQSPTRRSGSGRE